MGVVVWATVSGCGSHLRQQVMPAAAMRSIPVTRWSRPLAEPIFSRSTRHVQIFITPGRRAGDQFGWVFAEGTKLERLYFFSENGANELVAAVNDLEKATHGFSFVIVFDNGQQVLNKLGAVHPGSAGRASSATAFMPDTQPARPALTSRPGGKATRSVALGGTTGGPWPRDDTPPGQPPSSEAFMADAIQSLIEISQGDPR
jgi:hypothetical protein